MGLREVFTQSALASYGKAIRAAPRELIFNRNLILSVLVYALSAIPATWDQGSASVVATLPGFQKHFGISSGLEAGQIKNVVALVYIGYAWGSASSFFINDRIGRLWSYRLYISVYILGQIVATTAPGLPGLYAARIISGWGIGSLTVIGLIALVEITPAETRGLLTAWFNVAMGLALVCSVFCVLGISAHVAVSRLQYQIVFFSPCIFMALCIIASFFVCESPRWLFIVDRHEDAVATLVRLRGLPLDHPRVQLELREIEESIREERQRFRDGRESSGFLSIVKETFMVRSNLRRVQQTLVSYALAELSGANSITSYFVPILTIIGVGGGDLHHLFLTGMYGLSKFGFTLIASFFFVDSLGRRKSLFVGACLQMVSDVYIGVYIKYNQTGDVASASSSAAIAFMFIHAFGYAVGLFILPYVFGSELWPNQIRSFGTALSSTFHWLFIYAMQYGLPSLLKQTDNWGAFIFFAAWCFVAIVYVYLMVPETAGLSVEEIDEVFKAPSFNAYKRSKRVLAIPATEDGNLSKLSTEEGKAAQGQIEDVLEGK